MLLYPVLLQEPLPILYGKGKFPPTLTSGQATMSEAQKTAPILRQNRNAYTDISVEDSNSTQAQLFISDLFSQEKELQEEDFTLKQFLNEQICQIPSTTL